MQEEADRAKDLADKREARQSATQTACPCVSHDRSERHQEVKQELERHKQRAEVAPLAFTSSLCNSATPPTCWSLSQHDFDRSKSPQAEQPFAQDLAFQDKRVETHAGTSRQRQGQLQREGRHELERETSPMFNAEQIAGSLVRPGKIGKRTRGI